MDDLADDDGDDNLSFDEDDEENVIANKEIFAMKMFVSRMEQHMTNSSIHQRKQNRRRKTRKKNLQCKINECQSIVDLFALFFFQKQ